MRVQELKKDLPTSIPIFNKEAQQINQYLNTFAENELAHWMKLSPSLAAQTHSNIQQFGKKGQSHGPAVLSYAGDVYKGLMAETLTDKHLQFAQKHVVILSGMYGVLKPLDVIYPYRLEMGISLKIGKASSLYKFWGDKIAKTITLWANGPIINLASEEYFSAVGPFLEPKNTIHIHFREKINGKLQLKSAFAKKARGLICRYAIENQLTKAALLKKFNWEDYQFDASVSDEHNWFFVR